MGTAVSRAPRVSVGLPVYNGERYLRETLDSLLAQTFEDFELIICDNASTDGSEAISRAYLARYPRVRYVRHESNLGVARNFNSAFHLARGKYFKWAASDDLVAPQLLQRCYEAIEADPDVVLACPRTRFVGADGEQLPGSDGALHLMQPRASDRFRQLSENLGWCNAQYGLMRSDALRRTALFGSFIGSDLCFLAELTLYGKFFEIPDYLLFRRFHDGASSSLTVEQLVTFYEPTRRAGRTLRRWRHIGENLTAIGRSPLQASEKLRAAALVARKAFWQRTELASEVGGVVRQSFERRFRSL
jgi:glycosyltransferase involved in cell wall biosynthesis